MNWFLWTLRIVCDSLTIDRRAKSYLVIIDRLVIIVSHGYFARIVIYVRSHNRVVDVA